MIHNLKKEPDMHANGTCVFVIVKTKIYFVGTSNVAGFVYSSRLALYVKELHGLQCGVVVDFRNII